MTRLYADNWLLIYILAAQIQSIMRQIKHFSTSRIKRVIGTYDDGLEGPLIIAMACLHGNEFLPYRAIDYVLKMLEVEHVTNPEFMYRGKFIGICGNLRATKVRQRYIEKDLNRIWTEELVERISNDNYLPDCEEERELQAVWQRIRKEVKRHKGNQVIFLDFHTTSAEGGVFCMPAHERASLDLAFELYLPVVEGLMETVPHSCLSFMSERHLGKPTFSISVEVGQHEDVNSIYVAIATIINAMRKSGAVQPEDVESRHDDILKIHSKGLPRLSRLEYIHPVRVGDNFVMEPGFKNFQKIKKGTLLATDRYGPIKCKNDRILLMPLYQVKGSEGFYLIKKDESFGYF